ncbi:MAG: molybdopterin-guanine dinucleotide biosynthesis protein B [Dehalococcoidia bacterium]
MPPIVCIVGKSGSGKTRLLEGLIAELKRRGYRLAAVKHTDHLLELDQPGKDSWRLIQAGSDAAVISTPQKIGLIRTVSQDSSLEELSRLIGGDFDIILAEGFRHGSAPKIEVYRKELGEDLLCSQQQLLAIVSDEPLDVAVPRYSADDFQGLADFIEQSFLAGGKEEDMALFVNGASVPLSPFPREFIAKTLVGMISALHDVGEVRSLDIWLRRKS